LSKCEKSVPVALILFASREFFSHGILKIVSSIRLDNKNKSDSGGERAAAFQP